MLFSVILVFLIGFLFSNNLTLSQTPSRWAGKYFANPAGWNLNLTEPTLIPRFLHFVVAAVAVGGLLLVFLALANWKRDHEYARQLLQFGGKAFMYATMAQFVVGIVFLVSLPRDLRMLFMGDNPLATILLLIGVTGGIGAIFLMSDALRKENIRVSRFLRAGHFGRGNRLYVRHERHPARCLSETLFPPWAIRRKNAVVRASVVSGALPCRGDPLVRDAEAVWTAWRQVVLGLTNPASQRQPASGGYRSRTRHPGSCRRGR